MSTVASTRIYAQPLYVSGVMINSQPKNVVYVATAKYYSDVAPLRTPIAMVAHDPPRTLDTFLINHHQGVEHSWWNNTNNYWTEYLFSNIGVSPDFPIRTPIGTVAKSTSNEDVFLVDINGTVWRAYWDGNWTHSGYNPFGQFSSSSMLPTRTNIATSYRSTGGNLPAGSANGSMLSEWWSGTQWQYPSPQPWGATITSSWQSFKGPNSVSPGSNIAILANVPAAGNIYLFWWDGTNMWAQLYNNGWGTPFTIYP